MGIVDSALVRRVRQNPALRPGAIALYRTVDRLRPAPPGPRVVANSMPKSGTHLLASLLDQLGAMRFAGRMVAFDNAALTHPQPELEKLYRELRRLRDFRYIGGHLIHDSQVEKLVAASGVKLITILRDPRAVVVSGAHYVLDAKQLRGRDEALRLFPDLASVMSAMVYGHGDPGDELYFPEIGERYRSYAAWLDAQIGLVVTFESLIGERGGGSDGEQLNHVASMIEYLGFCSAADEVTGVAERLFSEKVITFRAGTIDSWRRDLPPDLTRQIEQRCADSMKRLGYAR